MWKMINNLQVGGVLAKGKYKYWLSDDALLLLKAWARDGLTDEDIAKKMDIAPSTLYEWKKKYSEISESLKRGKDVADIIVENSLFKRAIGYSYNEDEYMMAEMDQDEYFTKQTAYVNEYKYNHPEASVEEINRIKNEFPKTKMVLNKRKVKDVAPDVTAQIFWLKNRKPEVWRDKQSIEHSGGVDVRNVYKNMSEEELMELAKKYEKINSS